MFKYATRLNSFLPEFDNDIEKVFEILSKIGITHVDLNYPEHKFNLSGSEMKALLNKYNLTANGVAVRFRKEFIAGELGNVDQAIAKSALNLCMEAIDYCEEIGGNVFTIWQGFDGFDYSFQIDYSAKWEKIKQSLIEICDYNKNIKVSLEYKPFQPRAYAFIDSLGIGLSMIYEINRDNVGMTLDYCHMLMKHENPAMGASLLGSRGKLFGVHINDGYGLNDDGLMIASATPFKTLEFLYYVNKYEKDCVIYFDTFPVIENCVEETKNNIEMMNILVNKLYMLGDEKISQVIAKEDAVESHKLMMEFLKK